MLLKFRGFRAVAVAAIFLISTELANAGASQVAVIGPLEQLSCSTGTYRVLGVNFKATSKSAISRLCASQGGSATTYVVAAGVRSDSGKIAGTEIAEIRSEVYAAGASVVFVRGLVSRITASTGEFEVAGSRIVALSGQVPALGTQVDVIGTQPLLGAIVVAEAVYLSSDAKTNSNPKIADAIIGSGASTSAIIGSGSSTNAIIGSGSTTDAIIGSGATANAIIGSGASSKAIIGSGAATKAIIGSGASSSAIIGSGAK